MNSKNLKVVTSLFVALFLTISSLPVNVNAQDVTLNNQRTVTLQRKNNSQEVIQLPEDLSENELNNLKRNIMLYGNTSLTREQVSEINKEAMARGGLVYGSWFGGYSKYYRASLSESVGMTAALLSIVIPFTEAAEVMGIQATAIVSGLTSWIGARYSLPNSFQSGQYISATMRKRYREVHYGDGTFAYFETGFFANDLSIGNYYYSSPETIFSGGMY